MTDAEFCFKEDVRNRSIVKKGVIHKKNGSKSRKCTLPSDYLTASQKKKRNGECFNMRMNEPIRDWKVFRSYPENLQAEYLNNLVTTYDARRCDVAEMLGISASMLHVVCKSYPTPVAFPRGGNRNMSEKFRAFLNPVTSPETPVETDIPKPEISHEEKSEKPFNYGALGDMRFKGCGDKTDILKIVELMLSDDYNYDFWIDFTVKPNSQ